MSVPGAITQERIQQLPPHLASAFQEASERALKLSHEQYQPYPGQRTAGLPPEVAESIRISQQTGEHLPSFGASRGFAHRAQERIPEGYREYLDPNNEAILSNISRQGEKVYKEKIMPELDARFIRLGQYGSSKHAKMSKKAARDIQKEISSQQEEMLARNYQQAMQGFDIDRSRALETSNLFTKLGLAQQGGQLADVQNLREAGGLFQDDQQRQLDLAYERWKEEQMHPYERLSQYYSLLHGIPYAPSSLERVERQRPSHAARPFWRDLGMNLLGEFLTGKK